MKKLLLLFLASILLVACGNETKEPVAEEVKEEVPKQDEVIMDKSVEEDKVEEPVAEESKVLTSEEAAEIIEDYSLGENDKLVSVSVENGEIKAVIELAPNDLLPAVNMAEASYGQASDELLNHEGWEKLTIEYVDVGTVSMNRSEKETNEYGLDYFPIKTIIDQLN